MVVLLPLLVSPGTDDSAQFCELVANGLEDPVHPGADGPHHLTPPDIVTTAADATNAAAAAD